MFPQGSCAISPSHGMDMLILTTLSLAKGGFRNLEYDPEARYPSELARFGSVTWNSTEQDDEGWIHVIYPDVE